ncbi:type II toxin-antitoxin system HipA family toxin [Thioclava sp. JE_KL1]|uniref:type II toxin-antitoxin system HipA family toxin n=1 Tax=Thioclava sp. JE_KL1 TaxID=2651187 RepID=UPI00128AE5D7|nr:HipA domain-containing protein [Thioclava sp. JE_KL1]MPQ95855.1 type II toxin-antitoxin system HipA family toxin [Thioclava sp. JE_KL1]
MTSKLIDPAKHGFVWTWLPGATSPVVAGRIDLVDGLYQFAYGQSYLERGDAIALYTPELPLKKGRQVPSAPHKIAGCLRDGAPDNWGRRVIHSYVTGTRDRTADTGEIDELSYMLLSGSDRTGALDFQASSSTYEPRMTQTATLEEMMEAARLVEAGTPLPRELDEAMNHGTSIGGARPKAQITDGDRKFIAKFPSSRDPHKIVGAELVGLRLAERVGIHVARADLIEVRGRDVLLVERFDRAPKGELWTRRHMVSALTMLGLDEDRSYYGSYEELAGLLRRGGTNPEETQIELFRRMVFNILIGNTDDHARNHAAFWDGEWLTLTPAYDIEPRPRMSREANQAIRVHGTSRESRVALAIEAAPMFGLSAAAAMEIIVHQVETIHEGFAEAAEEARLTETDIRALGNRAILNSYAFEGAPEKIARLDRPL